MAIRVTVWHEFKHEKKADSFSERILSIYPGGMHLTMASAFEGLADFTVRTATLDEPEHGLTEEVLDQTDVLTWWGHGHHGEVSDDIVERVHMRVMEGMGLLVLHSAHHSKIFKRLMGTSGNLKWRCADEREVLWVTKPGHPITAGIDDHFILTNEEMYGEYFDVPEPMETLLISSFAGGEVFRSGMTWSRGAGKVFYFRPGHETNASFHDPNVRRILTNAARWLCPTPGGTIPKGCPMPLVGWLDTPQT